MAMRASKNSFEITYHATNIDSGDHINNSDDFSDRLIYKHFGWSKLNECTTTKFLQKTA